MSAKPYYTSTELIAAVQRKMSMPIAQQTFSEEDILAFATEELFLSQIPSILQFHEEYLVYSQTIPLEAGVSRYDLPERAIGMKLRDLFYEDSNGNLLPLANVGMGNSEHYTGSGQIPRYFHMEGDEIVVVPSITGSVSGNLIAKYYLRPNSLVLNERAGICTAFVKLITLTNASIVEGDILTIGDLVLVAGTDFEIGVSGTATATNIVTAISTDNTYTATSASNVITVEFEELDTEFSTTSAGISIGVKTGIQCEEIPEHFEDGMLMDFLQTRGGHKTYSFDVRVPTGGVSSDAVFFNHDVIPAKFVIGDYICEQNECIIPQIPSDLHNLLAERTCVRILEALGDIQGAQTTSAKISDLEQRQSVLIDNRVEGAPRKVVNRNSFLRQGKRRRF